MVFSIPTQDVAVCGVSGGPPQDCASGCFYGGGWILRHGNNLGWLNALGSGVTPVPGTTADDYPPYAFTSDDTYLFSTDAQNQFRPTDLFSHFRLQLTAGVATPLSTLEMMANNLGSDGWPALAHLLVDVAVTRYDRAVVQAVATVGDQTWNFSFERARAIAILANWPSSN